MTRQPRHANFDYEIISVLLIRGGILTNQPTLVLWHFKWHSYYCFIIIIIIFCGMNCFADYIDIAWSYCMLPVYIYVA